MATKYLCFDMDGTLIDSMECWNSLKFYMCGRYTKRTGEKLSLTSQDADFISSTGLKEAINYLNKKYGTHLDRDIDALGIVREYYLNVATVKSGVKKALDFFSAKGIKMCVITATPSSYAIEALRHFDLLKYFKFVLSPDQYPKGKRSKRIFYGAAWRFRCFAKKLVLIDDAAYALVNAKRAGLLTVGVYDQYRNDKLENLCDLSFNDFDQLLEYFINKGGFVL